MTKYRLKDAELQKKLDEITDGDFSKQLASAKATTINRGEQFFIDAGAFAGWKHGRIRLFLSNKEIEEFEEYDPDDWNNFPAVTPPDHVLMRVECEQDGEILYGVLWWSGRLWCYPPNTATGWLEEGEVKRFRPWE